MSDKKWAVFCFIAFSIFILYHFVFTWLELFVIDRKTEKIISLYILYPLIFLGSLISLIIVSRNWSRAKIKVLLLSMPWLLFDVYVLIMFLVATIRE